MQSIDLSSPVWVVGAGIMAQDYARVLSAQKQEFQVIGRNVSSAEIFTQATGKNVFTGGLDAFLTEKPALPTAAIVAVGVEALSDVTLKLLNFGVKNILLEKPGGRNSAEIEAICRLANKKQADVRIAYNRRFYSSVSKALEIIEEDGGVTSFNFEFTEWSHIIAGLIKGEGVKERWLLANSTHILDLAFFLGGKPAEMQCFQRGGLDWHPASSIFAGAGISQNGALFSYQANWGAPGRWACEILTNRHRLIFKPIEQLHIQQIGSVNVEPVVIDDHLDKEFKPGLYDEVQAFLSGDKRKLPTIAEQSEATVLYEKIAGYMNENESRG